MDRTPFDELPVYWQQHINSLRAKRASLRNGVVTPAEILAAAPAAARREIRELRAEVAKMRIQRNEARVELAALRDEWEQLSADAVDLWRGINPRSGQPLRVTDA